MKTHHTSNTELQHQRRKGGVLVLSVGVLILVFAFAAFAVDIGYITTARAQLQKSADAAALAATIEMYDGWGKGATMTPQEVAAAVRQAAVEVAAANEAAGLPGTFIDPNRDVRLGQLQWNPDTESWEKHWGASPYNMVEVTTRRDQSGSQQGDRSLRLFLARIIGSSEANIRTTATSALLPAVGLRTVPGKNVMILPFALDLPTWEDLIHNDVGDDEYSYDPETGTVSPGSDGVREVSLFPYGNHDLPPGNRGTVNIGTSNNSTSTLRRQIREGLNEDDLAFYGGEFRYDDLPMQLNGNTGISAGMKEALDDIVGQTRLIPIFSDVSGPGNNAMFTIVKFVPVRVLYARLTGSPSSKRVVIQPAPYVDATVITGGTEITEETIFAPASLVQ
jgi:hypothetical protein